MKEPLEEVAAEEVAAEEELACAEESGAG
jgi:hypothetical protein